jgi:ABC-2 type transport system ATP-binding protein
MSANPLIAVDALTVSIGKKQLINTVSFQVQSGSITGLIGENGAGKSTLIKAILDFSSPSTGTIVLANEPYHNKYARTILAYLPEHFSPPHYLNGQEYLQYCGKLYGVEYPPLSDLAKQLALPPEAFTKPVKTLSKGMTQKLGLLAVLNSRRPLLLLDEPMSGLDPRARFLLRTQLAQLQRNQQTTVLFTTHMLNDIQDLANHMLLMHRGHLHYSGTPADLLTQTNTNSLEEAFLAKTA